MNQHRTNFSSIFVRKIYLYLNFRLINFIYFLTEVVLQNLYDLKLAILINLILYTYIVLEKYTYTDKISVSIMCFAISLIVCDKCYTYYSFTLQSVRAQLYNFPIT